MRQTFRMAVALTTLAAAAGSAAPGWAQESPPSLVATTAIFAFHSDFEVNLHDALLEAGRTRWSDVPELFHSGEEAPCFAKLPRAVRSGWDHAVGFYAEAISPPQARTPQFVVRLSLIGEELQKDEDRQVAAIAASARAAAAPAYRACRWQRQDEENRGWIGRLIPLLESHELEIAERLAELYEKPLAGLPIRTDLVETVSWSGAHTIYLTPEGGHIWVRNTAGEGPVALETVFHEASHLLTGRGAPIPKALEEAAKELGVPLPRDLWHGVQFHTTGDLVRRILDEAGEPGYEPMTFAQDIFGEYNEALQAEWTGYLEGRKTMAEAARDLVRVVAAGEETQYPAQAESAISIEFVTPLFSDDSLTYPESSFSSPSSFIVFDPVVFGDPDDFENKTVLQVLEADMGMARQLLGLRADQEIPAEAYDDPSFQKTLDQLSGGRYAIRISGTVYDELANLVPDNLADIESVTLLRDSGPNLTVPVEKLGPAGYATIEPNELIAVMKDYPEEYSYEMPFPFVGRFQTATIETQLSGGINSHGLTVTNAANRTYGASVRVSRAESEAGDGGPLNVELDSSDLDPGMTNPVFVFINDDAVNEANVADAFATVNGHRVGLKTVGGRLQLEWPLLAIAHKPPDGAINVVQVGDPEVLDHFLIEYKGVTRRFTWSYSR